MGGWHAFPGGRLSRADSSVPALGSLDGLDAYNNSGQSAPHAICALRELFEETGILAVSGTLPSVGEIGRARDQLLLEKLDFGEWLRSHDLALDASRLRFAGRWVTPPLSPIRFDATFFLMEWERDEAGQPTVIPASWKRESGFAPIRRSAGGTQALCCWHSPLWRRSECSPSMAPMGATAFGARSPTSRIRPIPSNFDPESV